MAILKKLNKDTGLYEVVDMSIGLKSKAVNYNFSSFENMIANNSNATPKVEFKSNEAFGDKMYCGGICSNNKIYFCPNTADHVMVYDTVNDYIYYIGKGLGTNAFKYTGMVAYKGFLYCIPRGVNNMLKINPITDEVEIIYLNTTYEVAKYKDYRDSHHYNGCISDTGYLYSPFAYSSNKLLKINMDTFTHEEIDFTCDHSTTWLGCCNVPNNKIVFFGNKGFRIWNCSNDTIVKDINVGSEMGIYDMAYDFRDGNLYAFGKSLFGKLDLTTYEFTSTFLNWLETGIYGTVLGIDGNFYAIGQDGLVVYQDKDNVQVNSKKLENCRTSGMTVCSTGLVLANDGSIYSVPGNGRLMKISFDNVNGRLPDYIVTGRYYGKY